jgi:hypothetical protein
MENNMENKNLNQMWYMIILEDYTFKKDELNLTAEMITDIMAEIEIKPINDTYCIVELGTEFTTLYAQQNLRVYQQITQ